MKYYIYSRTDKKNEIIKICDNIDEAYNLLIYCIKKKKQGLEIIPFPEMKEGCTIYKSDGTYYGTIINMTDIIIGIAKNANENSIPDPFIKEKLEKLVLDGYFILIDGMEIISLEQRADLLDDITSNILKIKKRLDYIGAQQISFLKS